MASRPNFPGMNPYLEHPALWPEVHYGIISGLMRVLNLQITPKYRAAVDKRVYRETLLVGIPDSTVVERSPSPSPSKGQASLVTTVVSQPEQVTVPMLEEVTEYFLEIRDVTTQRVITVVEILSPKNKKSGEGRQHYLHKRQQVLNSQTHLVEIDLLRTGDPMPVAGGHQADYQILVSRAPSRPAAERYSFNLPDPIPTFPLPLQPGDAEPIINLAQLITQACDEAALDLAIDYGRSPVPPLTPEESQWLDQWLSFRTSKKSSD